MPQSAAVALLIGIAEGCISPPPGHPTAHQRPMLMDCMDSCLIHGLIVEYKVYAFVNVQYIGAMMMRHLSFFILLLWAGISLHAEPASPPKRVTLLAGNLGGPGFRDGKGPEARFSSPGPMTTDKDGWVYVADAGTDTLRKISPQGEVSTLCCKRGGKSPILGLVGIEALATDAEKNLYIHDGTLLYKLSPDGDLELLAGHNRQGEEEDDPLDGEGKAARFYSVSAMVADDSGNLFVVESREQLIRKVDSKGRVTTLAGKAGVEARQDGQGDQGWFLDIRGIGILPTGELLVMEGRDGRVIRKVTPDGVVRSLPIAGDSHECQFAIEKVIVDPKGRLHAITKYNGDLANYGRALPGGKWECFDLSKGAFPGREEENRFSWSGIAVDPKGTVFLASALDHAIYALPVGSQELVPFAGHPPAIGGSNGKLASFWGPGPLALDPQGNAYVAELGSSAIRKITLDGQVSVFAGKMWESGHVDGKNQARFSRDIHALAFGPTGDLWVADGDAIRQVSMDGHVSTFLKDVTSFRPGKDQPPAKSRQFSGLTVDPSGNVYVSFEWDGAIVRISPKRERKLVAGSWGESIGHQDGKGVEAHFNHPESLASDKAGNLYISEFEHLRKMTPGGDVSTLEQASPGPLAVDREGGVCYYEPPGVVSGGKILRIAPDGSRKVVLDAQASEILPWGGDTREDSDPYRFHGLAMSPSGDLVGTVANGIVRISMQLPEAPARPMETCDCTEPIPEASSEMVADAGLYRELAMRFNRTVAQLRAQGDGRPSQESIEEGFKESVVPGSSASKLLKQIWGELDQAQKGGDYYKAYELITMQMALLSAIQEVTPAGPGGPALALNRADAHFEGEIWYMDFPDMTPAQKARLVGPDKPLKEWRLPKAEVLQRDVFPFLVFRREGDRVRLEAVSREFMAAVAATSRP